MTKTLVILKWINHRQESERKKISISMKKKMSLLKFIMGLIQFKMLELISVWL